MIVGEDSEDIRGSLAGDGEAFARLVRKYQQPITRSMWRFSRDRTCVEGLVQDVFVEAYFSLRTFRGEAPFLHWLRKIATRVGYRHWKRQARERSHAPLSLEEWDQPEAATPMMTSPSEVGDRLHEFLAQLPPRDRLVLHLIYFEQCTVAEAAELTGWSLAMVKVQAFRARGKLKQLFQRGTEHGLA